MKQQKEKKNEAATAQLTGEEKTIQQKGKGPSKGPPKSFRDRMAAYETKNGKSTKPKFRYLKKGSRWDNVINKISKPGDPPPRATTKHTKKSVMERAIEDGTINPHQQYQNRQQQQEEDEEYSSKLDNVEILVKEPKQTYGEATWNKEKTQQQQQQKRQPQQKKQQEEEETQLQLQLQQQQDNGYKTQQNYPTYPPYAQNQYMQQQPFIYHSQQQQQQQQTMRQPQYQIQYNQPYFMPQPHNNTTMGFYAPTPNTTPMYQAAPNFMNHPALQQHHHTDPLQQPAYPSSPKPKKETTSPTSPINQQQHDENIVVEDTYYTNPENSEENIKQRMQEREEREAAQLEQDSTNFQVIESVGNMTDLNSTIRRSNLGGASPNPNNPFQPPNIDVNPFIDPIKLDSQPEVTPRSDFNEPQPVRPFKLFGNPVEKPVHDEDDDSSDQSFDHDDPPTESEDEHYHDHHEEEEEEDDEEEEIDPYTNEQPYNVSDVDYNDPLAMGPTKKKKQPVRGKKRVKQAPVSKLVQNYFHQGDKKKLARKKAKIEKHRERKEKEAEQQAQMTALSSELETYQKLSGELRRKMDALGRDRQDFENEKLAWEKQKEKEHEAIENHRVREENAIKKERRVLERQQHAQKIHLSRVESEKENAKLKNDLKSLKRKHKLAIHNHNAESDRLKSTIRELQQQVNDLQGALKTAQLEAIKSRGKKKKTTPPKRRTPKRKTPKQSPRRHPPHAMTNMTPEPAPPANPLVNYDLARENELFRRYVTTDNCLASMVRDDLVQLLSQPRTPLIELIFKSVYQYAIAQDEYFEPEPPTLLHTMDEESRQQLVVNRRQLSGQREEVRYRNHILQIQYRNNCSSFKYEDFAFEIVLYHNGHIRKSFKSGKKSYFYKEQGTLQMTYTTGVVMFTFDRKNQHEIHFPNHLKRIQFEDKSIKWDHPDFQHVQLVAQGNTLF